METTTQRRQNRGSRGAGLQFLHKVGETNERRMSSLNMRGKELESADRTAIMKYRNQGEHEMGRVKGLAAILGVAVLMAVVAACGNGAEPTPLSDEVPAPASPAVGGTIPTDSNSPTTPVVSHGGPVNDYISLVDNLRATGATVDPEGPKSADYFALQRQLLTVNGERIETSEFGSAEEAGTVAETVSSDGSSIGTSSYRWVAPPHFYRAGKLIVLYVGCDSDVINVLQETMGPQFAGDAGLSPCADQTPPATSIGQALKAADGSEITVNGFFFADKDGNTRLCSGLLESYPPQCGGDQIELLGFDASSVPDTSIPQRPSEIATARWTDRQIAVTGIKGVGGLAEVRLSTDDPTTQQGSTAPAPTESTPQSSRVVSHGGPANDYVSLVDSLRAAGATTDPAGNVSQPFFAPQGQVLSVNGGDVQAFEFASAEEADTVAATVAADGGSIGTSMVGWIAPPHFYKVGKLIVIYIGSDRDVIDALQEAMGSQFAGGEL